MIHNIVKHYITRPTVVEAVQYNGSNLDAVCDFFAGTVEVDNDDCHITLTSIGKEGKPWTMQCYISDYIMRINDIYYVIKEKDFTMSYMEWYGRED